MSWKVTADTLRAGTGTVTPAYPAGWAADDIFVIFIEAQASETVATPSGYTACSVNPQTATGTRIWMFWRRAVGGDTAPVLADPGDHQLVQLFTIRGATTSGNPWRTETGSNIASSATCDFLSTAANAGDLCILANGHPANVNYTHGSDTNLETPLILATGNGTTSGNDGSMAFAIGIAETTANVDASGTWSTAGVQTQLGLAMIPATSYLQTARVGLGVIAGPPSNGIITARVGLGVIVDTLTPYVAPSTGRRRGFMSGVI